MKSLHVSPVVYWGLRGVGGTTRGGWDYLGLCLTPGKPKRQDTGWLAALLQQ